MVPYEFFKKYVVKTLMATPIRKEIIYAAWKEKSKLIQIILLGIGSAVLEGMTFGLLAIALELLASNNQLKYESLAQFGLGWLALWSSSSQFVFLITAVIGFQVIKSVFQVVNTQVTTILSARVAKNIQQNVLTKILDMNFARASQFKVGELTNFVVSPAESVSQVLIGGLNYITNLTTIFAYITVLCFISIKMFFAAMVLFGAVIWLQKIVSKNIGKLSYAIGINQSDLTRKVVEGISSLRLINTYQRQLYFKNQVLTKQNTFIESLTKLNLRLALLGPLSETLLIIGLGGFLLAGFFVFQKDREKFLPDLLTFVAVLNRLSQRITKTGTGWSNIKSYASRASVINLVLGIPDNELQRCEGYRIEKINEGITFKNVSLKYPNRIENALDDISFNIRKGESIALVGLSGSGKSSVADLLLYLYSPSSGLIEIDGVNLQDINIESWRALLGVVSQDTVILNASVRDNLLFALPNASEDDLWMCLVKAGADSFVRNLPNSIDTEIGERGFMLSGGQRQRLAIARALLRNPAILIFDEATSSLDTNSETDVQRTIDAMQSNVIKFVIAHRLSTIIRSDKIFVLNNGKIVEQGKHESLIKLKGLYNELWSKQIGIEDSFS